jgi:RHS repeat-associated protein
MKLRLQRIPWKVVQFAIAVLLLFATGKAGADDIYTFANIMRGLRADVPNYCGEPQGDPNPTGISVRPLLPMLPQGWTYRVSFTIEYKLPPSAYVAISGYGGSMGSYYRYTGVNDSCSKMATGTFDYTWQFNTGYGCTPWYGGIGVYLDRSSFRSGCYAKIANVEVKGAMPGPSFGGSGGACFTCVPYASKLSFVNAGVRATVPFGTTLATRTNAPLAGAFQVYQTDPTFDLFTPASLHYGPLSEDIDLIHETTNHIWLRQVKSVTGLADIVVLSTNEYEIRVYAPSNVLSKTNGLWQTTNSPSFVYAFRNGKPTNANPHTLWITSSQSGSTVTNEYQYQTNASAWVLTLDRGQSQGAASNSVSGQLQFETLDWLNTNSAAYSEKTARTFTNAAWGTVILTNRLNPGSSEILTSFEYYSSTNDPLYGAVRKIASNDGGWEEFFFDTSRRRKEIRHGFGSNGYTTDTNLCRIEIRDFTTLSGSGDPGTDTNTPRTVIEFTLGKETARRYLVLKDDERREITCTTAGAPWTDSNNLVRITRYYTNGSFASLPKSVFEPDRTLTTYEYATNATARTNLVWRGAPDANTNAVISGTKTVTVLGLAGQMISRTVSDIATGVVLSQDTYSEEDEFLRPQRVTHLDGTSELTEYGCCGVDSSTDRDGVVTTYLYDGLGRVEIQSMNALTITNAYDASGHVLQKSRSAVGAPVIYVERNGYDLAGRLTAQTNGLGQVTTHSEIIDGNGFKVRTTTYPDGGTRIETFNKDGETRSLTGTTVQPIRHEYGVEQDGGLWRLYTKTIRLTTNDTDTAEWTKTYTDMVGNAYKIVHPDGAYEQSYFNGLGQRIKQRDADGVITLLQYNAEGGLESTATDVNPTGDTIDLAWDRVTRTITDVVTNTAGSVVQRIRSFGYPTDGSSASNLLSTAETSTDGLRTWSIAFGLTNQSQTAYATNGYRYVTNTAPDNSKTISVFLYGKLQTVTRLDGAAGQVGQTTFGYDGHGRQFQITDARNGTTSYAYDDADRVTAVTTPQPGTGQAVQTTTTEYDAVGRPTVVTHPDGASVTNEYYLSGLLKRTSGARTYPVEYTYDAQGRMTTMKTWQDFAGGTGSATTTWNYHTNRGWLLNKRYADNYGPDYTYTSGGRLKTRTWARSIPGGGRIVTTCKYGFDDAPSTNQYSDVVEVSYSDGATPTVTTAYDRLGRARSVTASSTIVNRFLADSGLLLSEAYSGGTLAGFNVTNTYDSLLRRATLQARTNTTTLSSTLTYGYDNASRLESVSDGTYSATYAYLANSALWQTLTFKSNSTARATTTRAFDYLNRLQSISTLPGGAATPLAFAYTYNQANQRTRRTDADSSYWVYDYDALGQVMSGKRYWPDGTPVAGQQFEYTFDDIGNRETTKEGGNASGTGLRSAIYGPNTLNQYTNRTVPSARDVLGHANAAATVTVNGAGAYRRGEYFWKEISVTNASGPAVSVVSVIASLSGSATTNNGSLLTPPSTETFSHDLDGNMLTDGLWNYAWDGENRLLSVESLTNVPSADRRKVTWEYDPLGRRIRQATYGWNGSAWTNASDLKLLCDGWACIAELNASGVFQRQYAWGTDLSGSTTGAGGVGGLLWMRPSAGVAHSAAYDGNGNVAGLVEGSTGTLSAIYEIDPFGRTLRLSGPSAKDNPFRFSTKRTEESTELVLYEYRAYTPTLGRWLSRDPSQEIQLPSLYSFLANKPASHIDHLGLRMVLQEQFAQLSGPPTSGPFAGYRGLTWFEYFNPDARAYRSLVEPCCWKINFSGSALLMMWWVLLTQPDPFFARTHEMVHVNYHRQTFQDYNALGQVYADSCYRTAAKADCFAAVIKFAMKDAYLQQNDARNLQWDCDTGGGRCVEAANAHAAAARLFRELDIALIRCLTMPE